MRRRTGKALAGRRIVVTRRPAQAGRLRERLERLGATVIELPTIELAPPRSWKPLDAALRNLERYDWVVFTSANGVDSFFRRLRRQGKNRRALQDRRVAAIGPATAAALRREGVRPDVVPDEFRAEGLLRSLHGPAWRGKRVLLARAAQARAVLPQELRRHGARVDVVAAYRTVLPAQSRRRAQRVFATLKPDAITFTSSSTARNFFSLLGPAAARRALTGVAVATIGPVTSRTVRALGLRVAVEANPYTVPALVRALASQFRKQAQRGH